MKGVKGAEGQVREKETNNNVPKVGEIICEVPYSGIVFNPA